MILSLAPFSSALIPHEPRSKLLMRGILLASYRILIEGLLGCMEAVLTMAPLSQVLYHGLVSVIVASWGNDMIVTMVVATKINIMAHMTCR